MEHSVMEQEDNVISATFKKKNDIKSMNYPDVAFYFMVLDAVDANEVIDYTAKPIFRPHIKHPMIDKLQADKEFVIKLLYNQSL